VIRRIRDATLYRFPTVLAIAGAVMIATGCGSSSGGFKKEVWRRPVEHCAKSPRAHMIDEVLDRLHRGMPLEQVRALLGKPDFVDEADGTWVYYVDLEDTSLLGTCVNLELATRRERLLRAMVLRDY
jgi:outer membrane protein assembly factor BamE (lipoprotein component of BamABCDE complex)